MKRDEIKKTWKYNKKGYYFDSDFDWDKFYEVNGLVKPPKKKSWLHRNLKYIIMVVCGVAFYILATFYPAECHRAGDAIIQFIQAVYNNFIISA